MSAHAWLVLSIGFSALAVLISAGFLAWLTWQLVWDLYDHVAQERRRNRHRRSHVVGGVYRQ